MGSWSVALEQDLRAKRSWRVLVRSARAVHLVCTWSPTVARGVDSESGRSPPAAPATTRWRHWGSSVASAMPSDRPSKQIRIPSCSIASTTSCPATPASSSSRLARTASSSSPPPPPRSCESIWREPSSTSSTVTPASSDVAPTRSACCSSSAPARAGGAARATWPPVATAPRSPPIIKGHHATTRHPTEPTTIGDRQPPAGLPHTDSRTVLGSTTIDRRAPARTGHRAATRIHSCRQSFDRPRPQLRDGSPGIDVRFNDLATLRGGRPDRRLAGRDEVVGWAGSPATYGARRGCAPQPPRES
jgi:hypothetical protein